MTARSNPITTRCLLVTATIDFWHPTGVDDAPVSAATAGGPIERILGPAARETRAPSAVRRLEGKRREARPGSRP
jgi:hypothetical protein